MDAKTLVLLIEDDPRLSRLLQRGLCREAFAVEAELGAEQGLRELGSGRHDVCVLDVREEDGFTLLTRAREQGVGTPVLLLTSDAVADRVRGLQLGADDCLAMPFALAELCARLRALLRRSRTGAPGSKLQAGDLQLDALAQRLWRGGQEIALSKKQFALLELLLRYRGQALSRPVLERRAWGQALHTGTNLVDVQVARLRQKIDRPGEPTLIEAVRGVGYRMRDDRG